MTARSQRHVIVPGGDGRNVKVGGRGERAECDSLMGDWGTNPPAVTTGRERPR